MNIEAFKQRLADEAFSEGDIKTLPANTVSDPHTHPFEVLALVLSGEIELTTADGPRIYGQGDIFAMQPECEHQERYGSQGVTYLVGRKHANALA